MIPFKLNGAPLQIASQWEDVSLSQYLELFDLKKESLSKLISIFTGVDEQTISKAKIKGLERIAISLGFLNSPMQFKDRPMPASLLGVKMPTDITLEHLGPYEDMMVKVKEDLKFDQEGKLKASAECKATYCAIYAQYVRDKEYDSEKVKALIPEVMKAPAIDVLQLGSFFLTRLLFSKIAMISNSPTTRRTKPKKRQTSRSSTKRSGRTRR
jgi:hypothetical protein